MHGVEIIGVSIPIIFLIGLFTTISLNAYFRYKSNVTMFERVPPESLGDWHRVNAQTKVQIRAASGRGTGIRIGGLLVGLGLGVAIGCIVLASGAIPRNSVIGNDAIPTFFILSLAMLCGGAGMIGAYFLERKLDRKD
ncbi:MAG: hypothetical protein LBV38_04895 [Alistipes sp.]|nr:hypothetical protein [Alistipes sp.]